MSKLKNYIQIWKIKFSFEKINIWTLANWLEQVSVILSFWLIQK